MKLNDKETALILAGLRLLQIELGKGLGMPKDIEDIVDEGEFEDDVAAADAIDSLCEKINAEEAE